MQHKISLVTGGTSSVGTHIVRALKTAGYKVLLHYYQNQDLAFELLNAGIVDVLTQADFTTSDFTGFAKIFKEYKIDLLINNAAIFEHNDIASSCTNSLMQHISINYISPVILGKMLYEQCKAQKHQGHIINIIDSDIWSFQQNTFTSYYLSKHMLYKTSIINAKHYAPLVRVNCIALPCLTQGKRQSYEHFANLATDNLFGARVNIEDLCDTITYLDKIQSITGQVIFLDNGRNKYH